MDNSLHYHNKDNWCTFCDEVDDKETSNFRRIISYKEIPSIIIKSTDHFFVVPGLGPMDQCYLLILPKESYVSMASLPLTWLEELQSLKTYIRKELTQHYTIPLMFEHGPATNQSLMAGCCIEHAHIHVFATKANLLNELQLDYSNGNFGVHEKFMPKRVHSFIDLKQWIELGISYLWYETNDEEQWGFPLTINVQSQYMRRILSRQLGLSDPEWDWALYPGKEKIIETWKTLSGRLLLNA